MRTIAKNGFWLGVLFFSTLDARAADPSYCTEVINGYLARDRFKLGSFDAPATDASKLALEADDRKLGGYRFTRSVPMRERPATFVVDIRQRDAKGFSEITITDPYKSEKEHITLDSECRPLEPRFCTAAATQELSRAGLSDSFVDRQPGGLREAYYTSDRKSSEPRTSAILSESAFDGSGSVLVIDGKQIDGNTLHRQVEFNGECRVRRVTQWLTKEGKEIGQDYDINREFCRSLSSKLAVRRPASSPKTGVPALADVEALIPRRGTWPQDLSYFLPSPQRPAGSVRIAKVRDADAECKRIQEAGLWEAAPAAKTPVAQGTASRGD